jgi:hypothetical protein
MIQSTVHGGCSSMAEHLTVDQVVVGSTPISHPICRLFSEKAYIFYIWDCLSLHQVSSRAIPAFRIRPGHPFVMST